MKQRAKIIFGVNKGGHHASVCRWMANSEGHPQVEIFLKERLTRVKGDGGSLLGVFKAATSGINVKDVSKELVCENTYALRPLVHENHLEEWIPYHEWLKKSGLGIFSKKHNPHLQFIPHHQSHAMAAAIMSPYQKSLILVYDGSGSSPQAFPKEHPESKKFISKKLLREQKKGLGISEHLSVYKAHGIRLECVEKRWQKFIKDRKCAQILTDGLGVFYISASKFIFNSNQDAGKVMGLAPFGKPYPISDRLNYFRHQADWKRKAFKGKTKKEWENSRHFQYYADMAASVQEAFTKSILSIIKAAHKKYPDYENLIITGGCALNCVANQVILDAKLFKSVYVMPFPGDESISLGTAGWLWHHYLNRPWRPRPMAAQSANFGPLSSMPTKAKVRSVFGREKIRKSRNLAEDTAELLAKGQVIGWFQGRSESGPRALGYRSILADPRISDLKDYLNEHIKFRESFRPYACSCPYEEIQKYFEVDQSFESPFMSFAPRIRKPFQKTLNQVAHIDMTSRVQTVRREQNPRFYDLLQAFDRRTGLPILLNTSMNVMGEPIVETLEDAKNFWVNSNVDALVVGEWIVERRRPRKTGKSKDRRSS